MATSEMMILALMWASGARCFFMSSRAKLVPWAIILKLGQEMPKHAAYLLLRAYSCACNLRQGMLRKK